MIKVAKVAIMTALMVRSGGKKFCYYYSLCFQEKQELHECLDWNDLFESYHL